MPRETDARVWLRTAGFDGLADKIDEIMESWRKRGLKTRRNWWEALAGTPRGIPMTVEGVKFPIISAVRQRLGLDPVKGAVDLPSTIVVPAQVEQVRWQTKRPKKTSKPKKSTTKKR